MAHGAGNWQQQESGRLAKAYSNGKPSLAERKLVVEAGGLRIETRGAMACLIAYLVGDAEIRDDLAGMASGELHLSWGPSSPFKAHIRRGYGATAADESTEPVAVVEAGGARVVLPGVLGYLVAYLATNAVLRSDVERMGVGQLAVTWDFGKPVGERFVAGVDKWYEPRWSSVVMGEIR